MPQSNSHPKKEIPFIDILKRAAEIVWKNKFLLWFGFLMALGSPGFFNAGSDSGEWEKHGETAKIFVENHWQIVFVVAIIFFAIGIVLFLISLIGKAGLIRSVNLIAQNKKTNFRDGWKEGKKYLWNLFKLSLLFFAAVMIISLVLALPVIYLAVSGSWISALLVGLLAVAIFIPLVFILALTNIFAEFYIVLGNLNVSAAVEAGYNLLLKNIGNSVAFGLLLMAVNIAAGLVFLPIVGLLLLILVPTGFLLFYISKIVFGIFIFFAAIFFLIGVLFASSIFLTYKTTAWTLFFREIAKVEEEETEKVLEAEKMAQIAAVPASPPSPAQLQQGESLDGPENA